MRVIQYIENRDPSAIRVYRRPAPVAVSDLPRLAEPKRPPVELAERLTTRRDVLAIWARVGAISKAPPRQRALRRDEFYGLLSLIAALAFCLGYYFGG